MIYLVHTMMDLHIGGAEQTSEGLLVRFDLLPKDGVFKINRSKPLDDFLVQCTEPYFKDVKRAPLAIYSQARDLVFPLPKIGSIDTSWASYLVCSLDGLPLNGKCFIQ